MKATDLEQGDEVLRDGDPLGFTVHGVRQRQGSVQVTDIDGGSYTFNLDETLEVR